MIATQPDVVHAQLLAKEYVAREATEKGVDDLFLITDYKIRCAEDLFVFWGEFLKFGLEASNISAYLNDGNEDEYLEQMRLNIDYLSFVHLQSQLMKFKKDIVPVFELKISKLSACVYYKYMKVFCEILSDEDEIFAKKAHNIMDGFYDVITAKGEETLHIQDEYISYLITHNISM